MSSTSSSRLMYSRAKRGAPLRIGGDVVAFLGRDLLDVGVMRERVGNRVVFGLGDEDFAVRPVPGRNLMAPPDLPRHAPRLDIVHPVEEGRFPLRRHEDRFALAHRRDRGLRQRLGVDIPLIGEKRLEHRAGAVAMRHDMRRRLDLVEKARGLQPLDDFLARHKAIEAVIAERLFKLSRSRHVLQETPQLSLRSRWPSASRILISGRSCRLPTSKSLKSCAGVILTAPEPFSGSA